MEGTKEVINDVIADEEIQNVLDLDDDFLKASIEDENVKIEMEEE